MGRFFFKRCEMSLLFKPWVPQLSNPIWNQIALYCPEFVVTYLLNIRLKRDISGLADDINNVIKLESQKRIEAAYSGALGQNRDVLSDNLRKVITG